MRLDLQSLTVIEKLRRVMVKCGCIPVHAFYLKKEKLWMIDYGYGEGATKLTRRGVLALAKKYSKGGDYNKFLKEAKKESCRDFG